MRSLSRILRVLIVMALLAALPSIAACGSGTGDPYGQAIELARTRIWEDINSGKASSGSVAILDDGNVVYAEGIGTADREKSVPVDDETLFNIGSVSKTLALSHD